MPRDFPHGNLPQLSILLSVSLTIAFACSISFVKHIQPIARASELPVSGQTVDATWVGSGPHTGVVTAMAGSTSSPAVLYAHIQATGKYYDASPNGLYKSTDSGAHWARTNYPSQASYSRVILSLAVDPTNPNVVYGGTTQTGIFKSVDGGDTWAGPYGQQFDVLSIAVDPSSTNVLYSSVAGHGIYKSSDGGLTWATASNGIQYYVTNSIRIDPANPATVYAVGGDAGPGQSGGVYKSTNAGGLWGRVNSGLPFTSVQAVSIDPTNTAILFIGTSKGIFKSIDGGANWTPSSNGLPSGIQISSLAINPVATSTIYAASFAAPGIFKSSDGGANWSAPSVATTKFNSVLIDSTGANVFGGSIGIGVYKSADGSTWSQSNAGLPFAAIRHLLVDPNNPATLYAGTGDDVYKSSDRGENWEVTGIPNYGRPIMGLVADPKQPLTLYAAIDYSGLFKTLDGGDHWSLILPANTNVNTVAIDPSNPQTLYFSKLPSTLYKTVDGGGHWSTISSPGNITTIVVDPSNSATVYAFSIAGLLKSLNGGVSWGPALLSSNPPINGLTIDRFNPATLYVFSRGATVPIRKSTDGGASWNPAATGIPATSAGAFDVNALVQDPINPGTLYASCAGPASAGGGVYRSLDAGNSWNLFGPTLSLVNTLALDFSGSTVYAGTDQGVFKLPATNRPIAFSTDLFTVDEAAGTATITVTRADSNGTLNVNFATSNGSAIAGQDYLAASGSLNFANGEVSKTFNVTILEDSHDEFDEGVQLTLITADGASTILDRAILQIVDNDLAPILNVSDVIAPEGDFDTTNFGFDISLSSPSDKTVTVDVMNSEGTATGADFFFYGGPYTLVFAPGETHKTVTIMVRGDLDIEADENFFVNATNLVNAAAGNLKGQGTIQNDDATPTVSLAINDVSVVEGNSGTTDAVFTVSLSAPTSKIVKVDYASSDGAGTEYTGTLNGTLTFAPNETTKTFTIRVIGDTRFEGDEQFEVRLMNPRNALMPDNVGILTIRNDDPAPTISINDVVVTEGDSGNGEAVFTVTLSAETEGAVTVQYETFAGTAVENQDYFRVSGAFFFGPSRTWTISVPIKGDTISEPTENFFVRLSMPTGAVILDGEGQATILDNDGPAGPSQFQFTASQYSVAEAGGEVSITVTRSGDTSSAATVDYTTARSNNVLSASDRTDYTASMGTLRFAAGDAAKTFKVLITDDVFAEHDPNLGDEFIDLALSNPTGGVLGSPKAALLMILDNDPTSGTQNPVDDSQFFVREHYHDFLNREPDSAGLQFWVNQIESCGADTACRQTKRINVSAAFFLSIEFQETGYLVYRSFKSAYGDSTSPNVEGTVPIIRLTEFLPDTQRIGQGVQVGIGNWQQQLENNKAAYLIEFVQRQRFLTSFPTSMSAAEFVNRLDLNTGGALSPGEQAQLVALLGSTPADSQKRAAVLRAVAEDSDLKQKEFNRAFVLMQYYGYLRRNADDPQDNDFRGWKFWLNKLDQFNGNFEQAEMVKGFLVAAEYRQRFGP
jgi:photosystem II stability/assembly factor-like uncharacterized protein